MTTAHQTRLAIDGAPAAGASIAPWSTLRPSA